MTRARDLGFTLEEVDELLSLGAVAHADPDGVKERAKRKVTEVQSKIRDLERMRAALRDARTHVTRPAWLTGARSPARSSR